MLTGLAITATIAAYVAIGCRIALRALPDTWAEARKRWGQAYEDDIRIEVRAECIGTVLFWPLTLAGQSILGTFDAVLNRAEVREFRKQLDTNQGEPSGDRPTAL